MGVCIYRVLAELQIQVSGKLFRALGCSLVTNGGRICGGGGGGAGAGNPELNIG